jgi:hypothetical protein
MCDDGISEFFPGYGMTTDPTGGYWQLAESGFVWEYHQAGRVWCCFSLPVLQRDFSWTPASPTVDVLAHQADGVWTVRQYDRDQLVRELTGESLGGGFHRYVPTPEATPA